MQIIIEWKQKKYAVDLTRPLDLSIPLHDGAANPNAFGIQHPSFKPFEVDGFIGSVTQGGSVNCENLLINAHGNGTHTECVGHISKERITINQTLTSFYAMAQVLSVTPVNNCILKRDIEAQLTGDVEALVLRTLPNTADKMKKMYTGNNPAYLEPELCSFLAEKGIQHLLVDLPSVDPEHDEGKLTAHHAYWQYPQAPRLKATITEMIFVPAKIADGPYLLNLQIAPIESDASPSKPVLYALTDVLQ